MNARTILAGVAVGWVVLLGGCGPAAVPPIPYNVADYERLRSQNLPDWPAGSVVKKNLTRVGNSDLPEDQRLASLELVMRLGLSSAADQSMLRSIVAMEPPPPPTLSGRIQEYLKSSGSYVGPAVASGPPSDGGTPPSRPPTPPVPGPSGQVDATPPPPPTLPAGEFQSARFQALMASGKGNNLSEVAVSWAQEPGGPEEKVDAAYRGQVEKLTGRTWDEALLEALSREDFTARGSAVELLTRRIAPETLAQRIAAVPGAGTDAMRAMKVFASYFGYVPRNGRELLTAVTVYRQTRGRMEGAADLAKRWHNESKPPEDAKESQRGAYYQFNIRDFHLLDGLSRDGGNSRETRVSLVRQLAQVLPARRTTRPAPGVENYLLGDAVGRMTMADLWNVWLLNEMLSRAEIRASLRTLANNDLRDGSSAAGGLVTYDAAFRRAEPVVYRAAKINNVGDDVRYLPSRTLLAAEPMSLCRWHGHFNRINNARLAGPTGQELQDAFVGNYSALVLTRLGENEFCAYYYNPNRLVLSLGNFTFAD